MIAVAEESMLLDQIKKHITFMKKKIRKVVTDVSLRFLENVYVQFIRESTPQHT
jgi:cystathionine beta-lyase family protein involved in aluminum resistance